MSPSSLILLLSALVLTTLTNALPAVPLHRRVASLSADETVALVPFGQFARAAYCDPKKIQGWKCGEACDALPGFNATISGGDGNAIQNFFVGFWPQEKTIIVAHEGTDPLALQSDLTDANILKGSLDTQLFPGAPTSIRVHKGFRDEHELTAAAIFTEVQNLLSSTGAQRVATVGHSLGGALSILEALSLRLRLPKNVAVNAVTFGAPRVGDSGFAQFFDSKISDIKRVNNKQDLVPIVPGRFLGFAHPQGEIHILADESAVICDGDDNAIDNQCTNLSVPTIIQGSVPNHLGPYLGQSDLKMGTIFCT